MISAVLEDVHFCNVIPGNGHISNMSQWDPLPTKLTTFGHLSSEEQQSSGFLSRIFRKTRGKSSHFSFFLHQ